MSDFASSSPINDLGTLSSRFNTVEEAWFEKTKKVIVP
jgi:hypothetical protein